MSLVAVLAHATDSAAMALGATLRRRGRVPVRVVSEAELTVGARVVHVVPADTADAGRRPARGRVEATVTLADGTVLAPEALGVVHSRLVAARPPHFARAAARDRDYAVGEFQALLTSWLASVPVPVVNLPSPLGLAGAHRDLLTVLRLAARAGLPVLDVRAVSHDDPEHDQHMERRTVRAGTLPPLVDHLPPAAERRAGLPRLLVPPLGAARHRLLVTGEDVTPEAGAESLARMFGPACRRFADLAGQEVCEIVIAPLAASGEQVVVGAGPVPRLADADHLLTLARHLEHRAAS